MAAQAQVRVLYADTDRMGQAYHGNFLRWFEMGRAELFRAGGMSYRELEESGGIYLPVIEVHCRYVKPAFYDDVVVISTSFSFEGQARLRFEYELHRESNGDLLATGYTVHVCTDNDLKVMRPPEILRKVLGAA